MEVPEEETLTSLREKRDALESLVKSPGWDRLCEQIELDKQRIAHDALGGPPSENEAITSAFYRGFYQGITRMAEYPEEFIAYAKQLEQEMEVNEDE